LHCWCQGASAQCMNKEGSPALHVAMINGHADAVRVLVEEGADVNVRGPTDGNSALHEAVLLGPSASHVIDALLAYVLCSYTRKSYKPPADEMLRWHKLGSDRGWSMCICIQGFKSLCPEGQMCC